MKASESIAAFARSLREAPLPEHAHTPTRPLSATCKNGHVYSASNTGLYDGKRVCRTCKRERAARSRMSAERNEP